MEKIKYELGQFKKDFTEYMESPPQLFQTTINDVAVKNTVTTSDNEAFLKATYLHYKAEHQKALKMVQWLETHFIEFYSGE